MKGEKWKGEREVNGDAGRWRKEERGRVGSGREGKEGGRGEGSIVCILALFGGKVVMEFLSEGRL